MANISLTKNEIVEILGKLSLKKIDDLFNIIPDKFKFDINQSLHLKNPLSVPNPPHFEINFPSRSNF